MRAKWIVIAGVVACMATVSTASAESPDAARARADITKAFGFVPGFLDALPDVALPGAWETMKALQMSPGTALSGKSKELIGLAVSAQVPCEYCVYAHTEFARLNGASDEEVGEAVVMASLTRHWSTVLNGLMTDEAEWRQTVAAWIEHAKGGGQPAAPAQLTDAASARRDAEALLGKFPAIFEQYPDQAIAGAWRELRDVELNPDTALSQKDKSLIGLAVAAQIPCRYCLIADTQFAKLAGATDAEIQEAIAISANTRHWSTWLNGAQVDKARFKKDVKRLVKHVKKQMENTTAQQR